jgi:hypothetical protein
MENTFTETAKDKERFCPLQKRTSNLFNLELN